MLRDANEGRATGGISEVLNVTSAATTPPSGVEGTLDRIGLWLERRVAPPLVKLGNQRHFVALRAGLIRVIPLIIVGSVPLILTNLPVTEWADAMKPYNDTLNLLYQATFGFLGLWVAMSVGAEMGRMYKLDVTMASVVTTCSFIITAAPPDLAAGTVSFQYFGAQGMFTAFVVAIIVAEVMRFMRDRNLVIKLPENVPANIAASFSALFPLAVLVFGFWLLRHVIGFELAPAIKDAIQPILVQADSLWAVTLAMLVTMVLWFVGIHGGSITIWGVLYPLLLSNIAANGVQHAAGEPMTHVFTEPWNFIYGMPGGVGITQPLILYFLLMARSQRLKAVGRVGLGPGIFNINEPVTFGTPLIMNPLMFIPFVLLTSTLGYVIGYLATTWGLVSATYIQIPWTTPIFLNAWLATGGDVRSVICQGVVLLISAAVWYPFFRIWDRRMVAEEGAAEQPAPAATVGTPAGTPAPRPI